MVRALWVRRRTEKDVEERVVWNQIILVNSFNESFNVGISEILWLSFVLHKINQAVQYGGLPWDSWLMLQIIEFDPLESLWCSDLGAKDECPKSNVTEKEEWNSLQGSVEAEIG